MARAPSTAPVRALLALAGRCACVLGPAAVAQARTSVVAFTPFAADGALRPGLRDAPPAASAACATGSFLLPGTGVLRCTVGVDVHDPCWLDVASSTLTAPVVACLTAPWRRDVVRLRVAPRRPPRRGRRAGGEPALGADPDHGPALPGGPGRRSAGARPAPALPLPGPAVPLRRARHAPRDLADPPGPQRGRGAPAPRGDPAGLGRRARRIARGLGRRTLPRLGEQPLGHAVGRVAARRRPGAARAARGGSTAARRAPTSRRCRRAR